MTNEMTAKEAVKQIKENCYFASISEKTKQALDVAIKALEQQGCVWEIAYERGKVEVLDKIRAEIEELDEYYDNDYFSGNTGAMYKCNEVLQIIDKYKAESEDSE